MPSPTLKDIYDAVNRVEDKLDRRICSVESRVDILESFKDNFMGKVTIITVVATTVVSLVIAYLKNVLKIG